MRGGVKSDILSSEKNRSLIQDDPTGRSEMETWVVLISRLTCFPLLHDAEISTHIILSSGFYKDHMTVIGQNSMPFKITWRHVFLIFHRETAQDIN